jgi:hypothetical protein
MGAAVFAAAERPCYAGSCHLGEGAGLTAWPTVRPRPGVAAYQAARVILLRRCGLACGVVWDSRREPKPSTRRLGGGTRFVEAKLLTLLVPTSPRRKGTCDYFIFTYSRASDCRSITCLHCGSHRSLRHIRQPVCRTSQNGHSHGHPDLTRGDDFAQSGSFPSFAR